MALSYSTTLRDARLTAITTAVGNAGKLRIYDGTKPAAGGTATNLLAELTLGSPFAPAPSGQQLSPTLPSSVTASGSGTATWFRIVTSGGTFVIDGTVTATGNGGDLTLNTTAIVSGGTVEVTAMTITAGNA